MDAAAAGVGGACDVLVGAATADEDVGSPLTGAGEGQEHASARVGVCAVVAREIGVSLDGFVPSNVEALGRFGNEDEEVTVGHEVDEGIHVVRLVLGEDIHWNTDTVCDTLVVEKFPCRIVVGWYRRVQAIQTSTGNKDSTVRHGLSRSIPSCAGKLVARFTPRLAILSLVGC